MAKILYPEPLEPRKWFELEKRSPKSHVRGSLQVSARVTLPCRAASRSSLLTSFFFQLTLRVLTVEEASAATTPSSIPVRGTLRGARPSRVCDGAVRRAAFALSQRQPRHCLGPHLIRPFPTQTLSMGGGAHTLALASLQSRLLPSLAAPSPLAHTCTFITTAWRRDTSLSSLCSTTHLHGAPPSTHPFPKCLPFPNTRLVIGLQRAMELPEVERTKHVPFSILVSALGSRKRSKEYSLNMTEDHALEYACPGKDNGKGSASRRPVFRPSFCMLSLSPLSLSLTPLPPPPPPSTPASMARKFGCRSKCAIRRC